MKILLNNNDLNEALLGISNVGFVPTINHEVFIQWVFYPLHI